MPLTYPKQWKNLDQCMYTEASNTNSISFEMVWKIRSQLIVVDALYKSYLVVHIKETAYYGYIFFINVPLRWVRCSITVSTCHEVCNIKLYRKQLVVHKAKRNWTELWHQKVCFPIKRPENQLIKEPTYFWKVYTVISHYFAYTRLIWMESTFSKYRYRYLSIPMLPFTF